VLSAVELGLFSELPKRPMIGAGITQGLALNSRAVPDFPDALVAAMLVQGAGSGQSRDIAAQ
jgi:hypothetical protein